MTASAVLHNKVLELTGSYLDVRQRWTPSVKRRISAIAEADPELHSRLTSFYRFYGAGFDDQLALAREWSRSSTTPESLARIAVGKVLRLHPRLREHAGA